MKMLLCLLSFATIFVFGCSSTDKKASDKQRAAYHLQNGSGHLSKGYYPEALGEFLSAVELDPGNPLAQNQLGLAYFMRGKVELAEKHFREALKLNPKFTEARNNLGRILIEQKKYSEAVNELKIATNDLVYGEPEKILANIGIAYFNLQDYNEAEKYFKRSLQLRRKNCLVMAYYGRSLYELSSFDKAAESLDQAMDLCKAINLEDPYYFSALSYLKTGQREQAVARLEEGLTSFPKGQYAQKAKSLLEILK